MKDATVLSQNLNAEIPSEISSRLKHLTMALDELLYHFWQCLPFLNPSHEKKFVEMRETLERFQYSKLQPFQEQLAKEYHRDVSSESLSIF